jgi:hypothetical protein
MTCLLWVGRRRGVPRSERLCPHCSLGDLGDERDLVFMRALPFSMLGMRTAISSLHVVLQYLSSYGRMTLVRLCALLLSA